MTEFTLLAWSAWARRLTTRDAWRAWAREPDAMGAFESGVGTPELPLIPPMQRRRMGALSKMALHVAFEACPRELVSHIATVFASRHGEVHACIALLREIARDNELSPTTFSHSVHNTAAGLFSIAAKNAAPSNSIAANRATFCSGLIDALGVSLRQGSGPVLLVVSDEPLPEIFADGADEISPAYALALLISLAPHDDAPRLSIEPTANTEVASAARSLPQALQFLAWMLSEEAALTLPVRAGCGWKLTRVR